MAPNSEKELGNGLSLRWSTEDDKEKIAHLLGMVFRENADEPFSAAMADWAALCARDDFPFSGPNDWAIVEDHNKPESPVVACTCLWSHQWRYADIPIGVGRPEFVATDPDYRNRGLIRAIFDLLHERSQANGDLVQAITGIPYFYRQFGYEYVLDLGGRRTIQTAQIPTANKNESESCSIRVAEPDDIPTIMRLYAQGRQNSLLWHEANEAYWTLMVNFWEEPETKSRSPFDFDWSNRVYMILDGSNQVCGHIIFSAVRHGKSVTVRQLMLEPGINLYRLYPSLLRTVQQIGEALPCNKPDVPLSEIELRLGRSHPMYEMLGLTSATLEETPYAWYIRMPDVPAFIRKICPILEDRLARSSMAGHTGELKVALYKSGLLMQFKEGKLVSVEPWRPALYENPNAGCPPLVFLQLLLGYRSLTELRKIFPDVWARKEANLLLNVLFPKVRSTVFALA
ncbi:MAG: GNAT family N-acetyltransferase [Chloroflexota bacterium]